MLDENRLKNSYSVAKKMVELGKERDLKETQLKELFLLGFNHDIGYEFDNGDMHGEVGGEILKNSNYKYWQEVYYHGKINSPYQSIYLDILNEADMQIDKYGNDVGYKKRLEDIKSRYGVDSQIYQNCVNLIESIKTRKSNKDRI